MEVNEIIELGIAKLAELNIDGRFLPRIDVYTKPTNHGQRCWICYKDLERGTRVVREMSGISGNNRVAYCYAHLDCYLAIVIHTVMELEDEIGSKTER
jgi:hypothetical protein